MPVVDWPLVVIFVVIVAFESYLLWVALAAKTDDALWHVAIGGATLVFGIGGALVRVRALRKAAAEIVVSEPRERDTLNGKRAP